MPAKRRAWTGLAVFYRPRMAASSRSSRQNFPGPESTPCAIPGVGRTVISKAARVDSPRAASIYPSHLHPVPRLELCPVSLEVCVSAARKRGPRFRFATAPTRDWPAKGTVATLVRGRRDEEKEVGAGHPPPPAPRVTILNPGVKVASQPSASRAARPSVLRFPAQPAQTCTTLAILDALILEG